MYQYMSENLWLFKRPFAFFLLMLLYSRCSIYPQLNVTFSSFWWNDRLHFNVCAIFINFHFKFLGISFMQNIRDFLLFMQEIGAADSNISHSMFMQLKSQFAYVKLKAILYWYWQQRHIHSVKNTHFFLHFNLGDIKVHKNKQNLLLSGKLFARWHWCSEEKITVRL